MILGKCVCTWNVYVRPDELQLLPVHGTNCTSVQCESWQLHHSLVQS